MLDEIIGNFPEEFERGLKCKNVRFYVSEKDFKFSFVVTDVFFSISFYSKNGFFDYKRDFICKSKNCIRWGMDLFNYVKEHSVKIDREKLRETIRNR